MYKSSLTNKQLYRMILKKVNHENTFKNDNEYFKIGTPIIFNEKKTDISKKYDIEDSVKIKTENNITDSLNKELTKINLNNKHEIKSCLKNGCNSPVSIT